MSTGVPVTTSDVTAATTLYFTPYNGAQISTYNGTKWTIKTFTEKSLDISSFTANKNYDIFIVDSTLALEGLIWSNDTTRATDIVMQNGVYVKNGASTRRYLGTIRITGSTGQCEDSIAHRFVWNAYNRVLQPMFVQDSTDSWTYGSATWRQARASSVNQVDYVCGISEDIVNARVLVRMGLETTNAGSVGIGIDSTSTNSAKIYTDQSENAASVAIGGSAHYTGYPGIGYHYIAWLEYARAGTMSFYGDAGIPTASFSGLLAEVYG